MCIVYVSMFLCGKEFLLNLPQVLCSLKIFDFAPPEERMVY